MKITIAKPGQILPQPPKDPNSGKMDSQIFIGKEDPQHVSKKRKKIKKKKSVEAKMGFPLETHDGQGFWDKRKRGQLGDLEFIEKIQIVKNSNWAGVEREETKRDLDLALKVFEMDKNIQGACKMIEDALGDDAKLDTMEEKGEYKKIATFNLKSYRTGVKK